MDLLVLSLLGLVGIIAVVTGLLFLSVQGGGLLMSLGIRCSMSRAGNCYANAVAESFFATFKNELVERHAWATRQEARKAIFGWIAVSSTTDSGGIPPWGIGVPQRSRRPCSRRPPPKS